MACRCRRVLTEMQYRRALDQGSKAASVFPRTNMGNQQSSLLAGRFIGCGQPGYLPSHSKVPDTDCDYMTSLPRSTLGGRPLARESAHGCDICAVPVGLVWYRLWWRLHLRSACLPVPTSLTLPRRLITLLSVFFFFFFSLPFKAAWCARLYRFPSASLFRRVCPATLSPWLLVARIAALCSCCRAVICQALQLFAVSHCAPRLVIPHDSRIASSLAEHNCCLQLSTRHYCRTSGG
ncbi:uncharacterized protein IWZ02DRAFT_310726 [Phyllosticta citriasiana]|uniref:uncharacterized protein n=1 Tax=Phyllosticta citriasiana TaxID=595635 RepID=UPI0030FD3C5B